MRDVGGEIGPLLHRGDLVIVGQPEQTPLAYYYLPAACGSPTRPAGTSPIPPYMNWVNALDRAARCQPARRR